MSPLISFNLMATSEALVVTVSISQMGKQRLGWGSHLLAITPVAGLLQGGDGLARAQEDQWPARNLAAALSRPGPQRSWKGPNLHHVCCVTLG